MVELAGMKQSARRGFEGCIKEVTSTENYPVYAGIAGGAIVGNVVAKKLDEYYTNSMVANPAAPTSMEKFMKFGVRTIGRMATAAGLCAVSGNMSGASEDAVHAAALGSVGVSVLDLLKTYGGEYGDYADLGDVNMRRYIVPNASRARVAPRAPSAVRPRLEGTALGRRPVLQTASLNSGVGTATLTPIF